VATVAVALVAPGSVSDYPADAQTAMRTAMAAEVGVGVSKVTLDVAAGSVVLTFTIEFDDDDDATEAATALSSGDLASAESASEMLGVTIEEVEITTTLTTDANVAQLDGGASTESAISSGGGGDDTGLIAGMAVVGALLVACLAGAFYTKTKMSKRGGMGGGTAAPWGRPQPAAVLHREIKGEVTGGVSSAADAAGPSSPVVTATMAEPAAEKVAAAVEMAAPPAGDTKGAFV